MKQASSRSIPILLVLALLQGCFDDCTLPGCALDSDCPKPYSRCLEGTCFLPEPIWQQPFCHLNPDPGGPCCDLLLGQDCLLPFPSAATFDSPPAVLNPRTLVVARASGQQLELAQLDLNGLELTAQPCPLGSSSRPFAPALDPEGNVWVSAGQTLCRFRPGFPGAEPLAKVLEVPPLLPPLPAWPDQLLLVGENTLTSLDLEGEVLWTTTACQDSPLGAFPCPEAGTVILACPGQLRGVLADGRTAFVFDDPRLGEGPLSLAVDGGSLGLVLGEEVLVMDARLGSAGAGWFRLDFAGQGPLSNVVFLGPGQVAVQDSTGRVFAGAAENGGQAELLDSLDCKGRALIQALDGAGLLSLCGPQARDQLWLLPPRSPTSVLTPQADQLYNLGTLDFEPTHLTPLGLGLALLGDETRRSLAVVNLPWRKE
jgi:hypothetical protein